MNKLAKKALVNAEVLHVENFKLHRYYTVPFLM
jgi:hypothetical protein